MALSALQIKVLRALARNRTANSAVGGATPLSRSGPRTSQDIDIFHDGEDSIAQAASTDVETLSRENFTVEWIRRDPGIWTALVSDGSESTKLEWVHDSDFRFFPVLPDKDFGFVFHPIDIATNKALAAAGRREPRDLVDLLYVHGHVLPLGAVIWAAVAKDPGWSPESLIAQIRRNGRYQDDDLSELRMEPRISAANLARDMRAALDAAEEFVIKMPSPQTGLLFLDGASIVQPDPGHLDRYVTHAGSRGGHWPSSSEVSSAMLKAWSIKK